MLSQPLPLIEKGKTEIEPKLVWFKKSGNPLKLDKYVKPNDAVSWYESQMGHSAYKHALESTENNEHTCQCGVKTNKVDRCTICGYIMDKNYNNYTEITPINFIYPDPVLKMNEFRGMHIQTITKPANTAEMRDYMMYLLGTNYKSINDVYRNRKVLPPSCHKFLTHRTQKNFGGPEVLRFDSNFECGNLARVHYVKEEEYDLYLNVDTNTKGHTQWFFFSVACTNPIGKVTFNIRNSCKWESVYGSGMKLSVFSTAEYEATKKMWFHGGDNITYKRNQFQRETYVLNTLNNGMNMEDSD